MARALASGFVSRGLIDPARLIAFDPSSQACAQFAEELRQTNWMEDNVGVVQQADVVILAVKPQAFPGVATELESVAAQGTGKTPMDGKLFISILAGVTLNTLYHGLRTERVVRVMPNTPCLVEHGAAAFAVGRGASRADSGLVETLFNAVGIVHELPEHLLDAVTGLSGSGPAYVYVMMEALSDGGVRMGLPRSVATALAAQTVLGAAQMLLRTGEHPGVLKDRVASPGGTTIAGLQVLERRGVRSALIDAVEAATLRSQELGSQR